MSNPPRPIPWHGYYEPLSAAQVYGDSRNARTGPSPFQSAKYPDLHPLLAVDTARFKFDVRRKPHEIDAGTWVFSNRHVAATEAGVKRLRIISKAFLWTIDIESPVPVTCEAVWEALYYGLQQPIADSEWGLIVSLGRGNGFGSRKQKEVVERAAKKRLEENVGDQVRLRRVDYLGEATVLKGLEKDEEFAELRLLPGNKRCRDTWIATFGTACS
ncbi:hypothetical protein LshimejAT787_0400550 [Lyophyllum shimeji]|uniref:DUF6699 domain-containing protein n=1 Tax=Lyophyllum shimeji TaxID=47721 RepID=A0A9P3PKA0_LYOSH|nr:hypothetical protein LshimejAT787_0400550 [Lyophyllum shimeji]